MNARPRIVHEAARNGAAGAALMLATIGALTAATPSLSAEKRTRFWNLTANTITSLQLAPAGTETWGRNQCDNDPDRTVDHDERLRVTGISSGRYDAKFTDKTGRTCVARGLEVKEGGIFAIEEKVVQDCRP